MFKCERCGREYASAQDFADEARSVELVCLTCSGPVQSAGELAKSKLPFSFGACGLTVLWLFFHHEVPMGLGLLVVNGILRFMSGSSVLNALAAVVIAVGIALYYGFNGSRIAVVNRGYRNVAELQSRERVWTVLGILAILLQIALFVLVLIGVEQ